MNPAILFVGNVAYQSAKNDLREHFAAAGKLTSCPQMPDKSRGFAFVE